MRFAVLLLPGVLAGCATPLAWEPTVERLPETAVAARPAAASAPAAARQVPVTFDEMVQMARSGTPSGVIIQKMRDSRLIYSVTAEQARDLAAKGVPPDVIAYLERGEAGIAPRVPDPVAAYPYPYPTYGYPYYAHPYAQPWWGHGYGPRYPGTSLYFGFGRRW
jgi:hypothetical protein